MEIPDRAQRPAGLRQIAIRIIALVVVFLLGVLFAVGGVLGLVFEFAGFGPPGQPRPLVVLGSGAQLLIAVAVPVGLVRLLFPTPWRQWLGGRWWWIAIGVVGLVVAVVPVMIWMGVGWPS